eukprot:9420835-Pyramimonas_sp.AAC.1
MSFRRLSWGVAHPRVSAASAPHGALSEHRGPENKYLVPASGRRSIQRVTMQLTDRNRDRSQ